MYPDANTYNLRYTLLSLRAYRVNTFSGTFIQTELLYITIAKLTLLHSMAFLPRSHGHGIKEIN